MLIGAHVPTMGDFRKMAAYAQDVGCECVQVFSCSPRSYAVPPLPDKSRRQLDELRAPGASPACPPILVHAGYLVNLASDDPDQLAKSCQSVRRGDRAGPRRWVPLRSTCMPVSSKELPREQVAARIAATVARARQLAEEMAGTRVNELPVVFEDTAGAGATFGTTVAELAAILHELERLGRPACQAGVCIDTRHAWAAGYDLSCAAGWDWAARRDSRELCAPLDCRRLGRPCAPRCGSTPASIRKHQRGSRKDRHQRDRPRPHRPGRLCPHGAHSRARPREPWR